MFLLTRTTWRRNWSCPRLSLRNWFYRIAWQLSSPLPHCKSNSNILTKALTFFFSVVLLTISVDVAGWSAIAFILETLLRHNAIMPENWLIFLILFIEVVMISSHEIGNKQDVYKIKSNKSKEVFIFIHILIYRPWKWFWRDASVFYIWIRFLGIIFFHQCWRLRTGSWYLDFIQSDCHLPQFLITTRLS